MNSPVVPVPDFPGFDASALSSLEPHIERVQLAAGEILFREGEPGDALYVVASGGLRVEITLRDGRRKQLAEITSGDCVGEAALLFGRPRSATVSAYCDSRLLKIRSSTLDRLLAADPATHKALIDFASRRLLSLHLASLPLFSGIDMEALRALDSDASRLRLAGNETLFRQGDAPDCLYVVVNGRLEVTVENKKGQPELVGQIGPGACVGEMGLLADEPRSATVRAIRDSELLRLSKEQFDLLLNRHPRAAAEIARTLARRLRRTTSGTHPKRCVSTIALVSCSRDGFPPGFTRKFLAALSEAGGPILYLNSSRFESEFCDWVSTRLAGEGFDGNSLRWLNEQEEKFRYVVFEADLSPSDWTELCLRQADLILFVASAGTDPRPGEVEARIETGKPGSCSARKELVLVHCGGGPLPAQTGKWLQARHVSRHHHVRDDHPDDYGRLVRFASGNAVGVVLGGGGARGYLHIGVIQALRESGVPIDLVGGASIGAIVAAQCALGYDIEKIIEMSTTGYGRNIGLNLIRDTTFPIVAILSARRAVKIIKEVFGDARIEDLWLDYFCVSANLSTAETVIHEKGPLWLAIRASGSVPGILPPVLFHGELLVDGGLLNNLPVDIMRSRAGRVIAVDIALPVDLTVAPQPRVALSGWPLLWKLINRRSRNKSVPHIFSILSRTTTLGSIHNTERYKQQADLYLHPVAAGIDTFDWKAGRKLIEVGYRHALVEIEEWKNRGGMQPLPPSLSVRTRSEA